jgi:ABC-type antimicrobial peptide transport system permease subunit/AraC-like DNA-binding protein
MAAVIHSRPEDSLSESAPSLLKPSLPADLRQKGIWLKNVVKARQYYQDPELSLASLAEKLAIHPHELSRIINTVLKKNFNEFINEYRVGEVARKMQDPSYDHLTLWAIAFDSGFNSKATFNRTFRQMTGKNPAEYKSDRKKEHSTYDLRPHSPSVAIISYRRATTGWSPEKLNRNFMFSNYLKIAWRNLTRNKGYAGLNILGLAVGIAASLLIFLVIHFETSFDAFHKKGDHIYRVVTVSKTAQGTNYLAGVPIPTAAELRVDYPHLLVASVLRRGAQVNIVGNNGRVLEKFNETDVYYVEPQFFNVFDFEWLSGDKNTALNEPNTALLTRAMAEKYFGDWTKAVGKTINLDNESNLKVTGILKNMPVNTDLHLQVVVSYATLKTNHFKDAFNDAGGIIGSHYCFVVLPDNMTSDLFNSELVSFAKKHKPVDHIHDGLVLQPLHEMHYDSRFEIYSGKTFSKELLRSLSLIGLFLLVIAGVNFVNMATAQAVNRSKEVGIRKVLGSHRKGLMLQFLTETFIITLSSVILAIAVAEIALPYLNQLLGIKLKAVFWTDEVVLFFLLAATLAITLFSGFYPALVISGFNPITALKNKVKAGSKGGVSLRRGLVVLQFSIAQLLIIGTLVIVSQMNYFKNYPLGFNKDEVINVPLPGDDAAGNRLTVLRNQLLQQPGIKDVSFSYTSPSDNYYMDNYFKYDNSARKTDFLTQFKWADAEYFKLYDLQFVAGHPYAESDSIRGYVVNETLLKKLGVRNPNEAIGKYINIWDDKTKYAPIVGVVKDFNVSSLKDEIPPLLMASSKDFFATINIKLQPVNINQTLASIEKLWNAAFPNDVYEYQFLTDKIAKFYSQQDQLSVLYKIFAGIAIFISCLGLFGLVSFMAVQRTKEVGIRKTLGASVSHIVYLFSIEFTLLILIAFGISAPVGWYFMHLWLQAFVYKISIGPGLFILAVAASVVIAWITVCYKIVQAARANPVKSLRSE